jgi:hypothetical protein
MQSVLAISCIEHEDDIGWHTALVKQPVMRYRYDPLQSALPSRCAITQQQVETYEQDFQQRLQYLETNRWWFEISHFNAQLNTSVGHLWMLFSAVWPCASLERIGAVMDGGAVMTAST